ncbi:hypothetical protein L6164_012821 [Bauhinia variegata]|uniref:Uncharacterized protein n=1 Tax=Bauhinia variegata TaxID=167791 RepID=A0ACB9PBE4_BAUVA|nr:hypothetical protein L6164_012821 [Bauhinia variegata]
MSSLGIPKRILEIAKFGIYVTIPLVMMNIFANNSENIQRFMGNVTFFFPYYIEYPPEVEQPPSPEELRMRAQEFRAREDCCYANVQLVIASIIGFQLRVLVILFEGRRKRTLQVYKFQPLGAIDWICL